MPISVENVWGTSDLIFLCFVRLVLLGLTNWMLIAENLHIYTIRQFKQFIWSHRILNAWYSFHFRPSIFSNTFPIYELTTHYTHFWNKNNRRFVAKHSNLQNTVCVSMTFILHDVITYELLRISIHHECFPREREHEYHFIKW